MSKEKVRIELDPLNDGIVGEVKKLSSGAGKYLVIGTNGEHRLISEEEYFDYVDAMDKVPLFIADYMLFFERSKMLFIDGDAYLAGSFLLVKLTDKPGEFRHMTEDEIDEIKENLSGYMVDIFIDGERYSALEIV